MNNMLTANVKRWFQKSYGNTYHSVTLQRDNEVLQKENFCYGYGRQYEQTTKKMLENLGLCNETVTYHVVDVKRKKDL